MVEVFDGRGVSFVSVTQQFNTTTSMGRLTLNVLLSFAQFEREVTATTVPTSAFNKTGVVGHCPSSTNGNREPASRGKVSANPEV